MDGFYKIRMQISLTEENYNKDNGSFTRWYAFCLSCFLKPRVMKKTNKILVGVGIAAVTAGLLIYAVRRYRSSQRRTKIANEGYETAQDILYPQKIKGKKVALWAGSS